MTEGLIWSVLFAVTTSLSVTLSSSGVRLVRETYSLTCSASVSGGGSVSRIVWLRGTATEMEMNSASTLTLAFQPFSASDDGSYTCLVVVGNLVKMNSSQLVAFTSNPSKIRDNIILFISHSRNCNVVFNN